MSARLRTRSLHVRDQHGVSLVEMLIVAPVVVLLALGALSWS